MLLANLAVTYEAIICSLSVLQLQIPLNQPQAYRTDSDPKPLSLPCVRGFELDLDWELYPLWQVSAWLQTLCLSPWLQCPGWSQPLCMTCSCGSSSKQSRLHHCHNPPRTDPAPGLSGGFESHWWRSPVPLGRSPRWCGGGAWTEWPQLNSWGWAGGCRSSALQDSQCSDAPAEAPPSCLLHPPGGFHIGDWGSFVTGSIHHLAQIYGARWRSSSPESEGPGRPCCCLTGRGTWRPQPDPLRSSAPTTSEESEEEGKTWQPSHTKSDYRNETCIEQHPKWTYGKHSRGNMSVSCLEDPQIPPATYSGAPRCLLIK